MKGKNSDSFIFKSWGGHINLHIPFDPIMFFMAEAPSEGSSAMRQKVLTFKGADELAAVCVTE